MKEKISCMFYPGYECPLNCLNYQGSSRFTEDINNKLGKKVSLEDVRMMTSRNPDLTENSRSRIIKDHPDRAKICYQRIGADIGYTCKQ